MQSHLTAHGLTIVAPDKYIIVIYGLGSGLSHARQRPMIKLPLAFWHFAHHKWYVCLEYMFTTGARFTNMD